jgi:hypothetical protein
MYFLYIIQNSPTVSPWSLAMDSYHVDFGLPFGPAAILVASLCSQLHKHVLSEQMYIVYGMRTAIGGKTSGL